MSGLLPGGGREGRRSGPLPGREREGWRRGLLPGRRNERGEVEGEGRGEGVAASLVKRMREVKWIANCGERYGLRSGLLWREGRLVKWTAPWPAERER